MPVLFEFFEVLVHSGDSPEGLLARCDGGTLKVLLDACLCVLRSIRLGRTLEAHAMAVSFVEPVLVLAAGGARREYAVGGAGRLTDRCWKTMQLLLGRLGRARGLCFADTFALGPELHVVDEIVGSCTDIYRTRMLLAAIPHGLGARVLCCQLHDAVFAKLRSSLPFLRLAFFPHGVAETRRHVQSWFYLVCRYRKNLSTVEPTSAYVSDFVDHCIAALALGEDPRKATDLLISLLAAWSKYFGWSAGAQQLAKLVALLSEGVANQAKRSAANQAEQSVANQAEWSVTNQAERSAVSRFLLLVSMLSSRLGLAAEDVGRALRVALLGSALSELSQADWRTVLSLAKFHSLVQDGFPELLLQAVRLENGRPSLPLFVDVFAGHVGQFSQVLGELVNGLAAQQELPSLNRVVSSAVPVLGGAWARPHLGARPLFGATTVAGMVELADSLVQLAAVPELGSLILDQALAVVEETGLPADGRGPAMMLLAGLGRACLPHRADRLADLVASFEHPVPASDVASWVELLYVVSRWKLALVRGVAKLFGDDSPLRQDGFVLLRETGRKIAEMIQEIDLGEGDAGEGDVGELYSGALGFLAARGIEGPHSVRPRCPGRYLDALVFFSGSDLREASLTVSGSFVGEDEAAVQFWRAGFTHRPLHEQYECAYSVRGWKVCGTDRLAHLEGPAEPSSGAQDYVVDLQIRPGRIVRSRYSIVASWSLLRYLLVDLGPHDERVCISVPLLPSDRLCAVLEALLARGVQAWAEQNQSVMDHVAARWLAEYLGSGHVAEVVSRRLYAMMSTVEQSTRIYRDEVDVLFPELRPWRFLECILAQPDMRFCPGLLRHSIFLLLTKLLNSLQSPSFVRFHRGLGEAELGLLCSVTCQPALRLCAVQGSDSDD